MLALNNLRHIFFDFDGVFTDNSVYVFEDGKEAVRCSRADGFGLRALSNIGVTSSIISTETNPVAKWRAKKLNISIDLSVKNKTKRVIEYCSKAGFDLLDVAFMGNDINDLEVMQTVGVSICPKDAWPEILKISDLRTSKKGGYGAVRELCDFIVTGREKND